MSAKGSETCERKSMQKKTSRNVKKLQMQRYGNATICTPTENAERNEENKREQNENCTFRRPQEAPSHKSKAKKADKMLEWRKNESWMAHKDEPETVNGTYNLFISTTISLLNFFPISFFSHSHFDNFYSSVCVLRWLCSIRFARRFKRNAVCARCAIRIFFAPLTRRLHSVSPQTMDKNMMLRELVWIDVRTRALQDALTEQNVIRSSSSSLSVSDNSFLLHI